MAELDKEAELICLLQNKLTSVFVEFVKNNGEVGISVPMAAVLRFASVALSSHVCLANKIKPGSKEEEAIIKRLASEIMKIIKSMHCTTNH